MGVNINQVYIDQSAGTRRSSDNPLAMSIAGEGYFTVNTHMVSAILVMGIQHGCSRAFGDHSRLSGNGDKRRNIH